MHTCHLVVLSFALTLGLANAAPKPAPAPKPGPGPGPEAPKVDLGDVAKVKTALDAWDKAKTKCGGNYEYTVQFSSAFGFGHTTMVVVKNNKVIERRYEEFGRNNPPVPGAPPNGFVEKGEAVGKDKKGAPAKTLDEIYKAAPDIAAKALLPHERRYVITNEAGLLTSCFTIDTRIAGDVPHNGVSLGTIKLNAVKKTEVVPPAGVTAVVIAADAPENAPAAVAVKVHSGHFVSNQYKPADALTLALFNTMAEFKAAFGVAAFGLGRNKRLDYVDEAAFTNGVVAALIHRGNTPYQYELIGEVKNARGVVTLNFRAAGEPSPTATFASPLIVSMPRAGITHVRFVENDRVLGQVALAPAAAVGAPKEPTPAPALPGIGKVPVKAGRKPFPAHWGQPPRIQTSDFGTLPGGYGQGSSTLAGWINKNMEADAKDPNRAKANQPDVKPDVKPGVKPDDKQAEIARIQMRILAIENLKKVARFTQEGLAKINAELAELKARLKQLQAEDPAAPGKPAPAKPQAQRPPVSKTFALQHSADSYAPGELLIGMQEGLAKADGEKALTAALPGLTVLKGMFNNTILHVQLPPTVNVEQAMAALKKVQCVRYSELNGIASTQPVPRAVQ